MDTDKLNARSATLRAMVAGRPGTRHKSKISDKSDEFVQASSRGRKDWARTGFLVDEVTVSVDEGTEKSVVIDREN